MNDAEKHLLIAIYQSGWVEGDPSGIPTRQLCQTMGIYKQNCYYLDKWSSKGWYDYGVSLDLGWLTPEGVTKAQQLQQRGQGE